MSRPDTRKPEQSTLPSHTEHSLENQSDWIVQGIKHEIFMRVFPSLRHGLVGPISIARMSISIVRRLLARGEASLTALNEPVERIDQQLAEAVLGIRSLQHWEPGTKPQTQQVADIIREGITLMTAPLAMREIVVDYAADSADVSGEISQHAALLYVWLGLLCYVQDSLQQAASLKVRLQAQSLSVQWLLNAKAHEQGRSRSSMLLSARVIDRSALETLARASGFSLDIQPDSVHLGWV